MSIYVVVSALTRYSVWKGFLDPKVCNLGARFVGRGRYLGPNAHVTLDATFIEVRRHGLPARYQAEVRSSLFSAWPHSF